MKFSRQDVIAGVTGAVVGIPQAMGFALIAGIDPIYGLYTAILSTIIASLVIRSSLLTVSPTNAIALVVASTLSAFDEGIHPQALFTLTFLVGVIQVAAGYLRLQRYTRLVSNAVMTGFITGASLLIILGQAANLTGYRVAADVDGAIPEFMDWLLHINQWDWVTIAFGVGSLLSMVALRYTPLKYLSAFVSVAGASAIAFWVNAESVRVVGDIAAIPAGLPAPSLPDIGLMPDLFPSALALAVLALIQSIGITQSVDEMEDVGLNDRRDFYGQGIANLVGGFFQNMPSGGSLSRTAVNISAGAQTRFANLIAGGVIALSLLFFAPAIEQVLLAALAAQLMVAAVRLIRPTEIWHTWRVSRSGRYAMLITFASTLVLPLEFAIFIGVGLHVFEYVLSASQHVNVVQLIKEPEVPLFTERPSPDALREPVTILSIQGNLFFAGMPFLKQQLPYQTEVERPIIILRLRNISYLGTTGIRVLADYADWLQQEGGELILSGVAPHIQAQLHEYENDNPHITGLGVFAAEPTIFQSTIKAWEHARSSLEETP